MNKPTQLLLALFGALPTSAAFACASCGCSINSDWSAQGLSATPGWSLDVRYDYLNQNKLWAGTSSISPTAAAATTIPATGEAAEVEQYTKNHYLTATVDYSNGDSWGVSLSLPFIDRSHSTLGSGSDGTTFDPANGAYTSSGRGLGDVRVVGRYFGFTDLHNLGLQLGLKLPTGKKNQVGEDGGTDVDPGLQRGTGTTDLIVGAYYFGDIATDWGYFTQGTFQTALNRSTMAGGSYKPGDSVSVSVGARYKGFASFVPTVQINARYAKTDSGDAADTFATGGRLVYLTLGGILPVSERFAPYANVQVPVYQNVNGIQLTPKYTVSVGAKYAF
jgi:hypothetical protein